MRLNAKAIAFFAAAFVSASVLLWLIHPASGGFGGLLYFVIGAAPFSTACAIFLALGCVWPFPWSLPVKIIAAVILASFFALNTSLFGLSESILYRAKTVWTVNQSVQIRSGERIYLRMRSLPLIYSSPHAGSAVQIGANEGCMCSYFEVKSNSLYVDMTLFSLRRHTGGAGGSDRRNYDAVPEWQKQDTYVDIQFQRLAGGFKATIDVFKAGEKAASFVHENIPLDADGTRLQGYRSNLTDNFLANALDILLHENPWNNVLIQRLPAYYPKTDVDAFFRAAFAGR